MHTFVECDTKNQRTDDRLQIANRKLRLVSYNVKMKCYWLLQDPYRHFSKGRHTNHHHCLTRQITKHSSRQNWIKRPKQIRTAATTEPSNHMTQRNQNTLPFSISLQNINQICSDFRTRLSLVMSYNEMIRLQPDCDQQNITVTHIKQDSISTSN
jgi:hypothetical protein